MNNALSQDVPSSLPVQYNIPRDYKKRAEWFIQEFGETMSFHLENLFRFCGHLKKNQAISFSEINPEGYIHAHYGQYSLYFPVEKIEKKIAPIDWMNNYSLQIDNMDIVIDSGMQEIYTKNNNSQSQVSTVKSRLMDTLLPGNQVKKDQQKQGITSQNAVIKRIIRVIPKTMTHA